MYIALIFIKILLWNHKIGHYHVISLLSIVLNMNTETISCVKKLSMSYETENVLYLYTLWQDLFETQVFIRFRTISVARRYILQEE